VSFFIVLRKVQKWSNLKEEIKQMALCWSAVSVKAENYLCHLKKSMGVKDMTFKVNMRELEYFHQK